jgi:hypothetical protein
MDAERVALVAHIEGRLHRGGNPRAVITELEARGLSRSEAEALLAEVLEPLRAGYRKAGRATVIKGLGLLGLGALVTFGTMALALDGGTYLVTVGLFSVGGLYVVKGLAQMAHGGPSG